MLFSLISTSRQILHKIDIRSVRIPTLQGQMEVLPHHVPVLGVTAPGILYVDQDKEITHYAIGAGIYEVDQEGVRVIADMVENSSNTQDIAKRKAEAEALMKKARTEGLQNSEEFLNAEQEYLKQTALEQLTRLKK